MPYLAYDLDAFENAQSIATSCGTSVEKVTHGSLTMWRHVWRTRSDIITTAHVVAFYGVNACEALVLFGQLEASDAGWRVKGAAKWLKVQAARSDNGKANSGNLRRGKSSGNLPAASRQSSGSSPALAASSQQPAANSQHKISAGQNPPAEPKPKKPPDPRHAPLVARLGDAYADETRGSKYAFGGRDAKAVTSLIALSHDDEEIIFKWRSAVRSSFDKFQSPKTRTLPDLVRDWNSYTAIKNGQRDEMRL